MPPRERQREARRSPLWLRRADQLTVATLVAIGLLAMIGYWFVQGGHRGRLIDIDRAEPLEAEFLVDINEADWPELAQLPNIGETLARRIVALRETDGPFIDHEDLRRVQGIGPRTLDGIRPYLLPMPDGAAVAGDVDGEKRG